MLARFPSERGYQIGHHLNQLGVTDSRGAPRLPGSEWNLHGGRRGTVVRSGTIRFSRTLGGSPAGTATRSSRHAVPSVMPGHGAAGLPCAPDAGRLRAGPHTSSSSTAAATSRWGGGRQPFSITHSAQPIFGDKSGGRCASTSRSFASPGFGGPHGLAVGGRPVRVPLRLQGLADNPHVVEERIDAGDVSGLSMPSTLPAPRISRSPTPRPCAPSSLFCAIAANRS